MPSSTSLHQGLEATGAEAMWSRIIQAACERAAPLLPPGSRVLEIGYGDGLLTCHLARTYGWRITGLEVLQAAYEKAVRHTREMGLESEIDFRLVKPEDTWRHQGTYDGVFIKTVLYLASSLEEYGRWLDWVVSVLRPGGTFVNFENGKTNRLTYWYRRLRRRPYADASLYDGRIQKLYEARFVDSWFGHYGSLSQFFSPVPWLYHSLAFFEERFFVRTADNSYVTSIVARKGEGSRA